MESSLLSHMFRRYQCAQEHPCFYALTTLFPSISRYKRSHTLADKQDGNSNDDPIFSPTHFHSVKQPIPRVFSGLIMMPLTRIYALSLLRCLFILSHCLDPHHGHNKPTLTNLFWPASTLSMFTLQPHIRCHDANTCHWHPRRPYCRQKVKKKRTTSLALPLSAWF